jgi:hypothetical protein
VRASLFRRQSSAHDPHADRRYLEGRAVLAKVIVLVLGVGVPIGIIKNAVQIVMVSLLTSNRSWLDRYAGILHFAQDGRSDFLG